MRQWIIDTFTELTDLTANSLNDGVCPPSVTCVKFNEDGRYIFAPVQITYPDDSIVDSQPTYIGTAIRKIRIKGTLLELLLLTIKMSRPNKKRYIKILNRAVVRKVRRMIDGIFQIKMGTIAPIHIPNHIEPKSKAIGIFYLLYHEKSANMVMHVRTVDENRLNLVRPFQEKDEHITSLGEIETYEGVETDFDPLWFELLNTYRFYLEGKTQKEYIETLFNELFGPAEDNKTHIHTEVTCRSIG